MNRASVLRNGTISLRYLKKMVPKKFVRYRGSTKFGVCVGPLPLQRGMDVPQSHDGSGLCWDPFSISGNASHPWTTFAQWIILTVKGGCCALPLCIAWRVLCRLHPLSFHAPSPGKERKGAGPKVWGRGKLGKTKNPTDSSELLLVYVFDHW